MKYEIIYTCDRCHFTEVTKNDYIDKSFKGCLCGGEKLIAHIREFKNGKHGQAKRSSKVSKNGS